MAFNKGLERKRQLEAEELAARAEKGEANEVDLDALIAAEEAEQVAAETAAVVPSAAAVQGGAPIAMTFEQIMTLVREMKGTGPTPEQLVDMATKAAMAGADRVKPKELKISETEQKSAFNPLGEKNHPRPKLKCHMYFGSAPLGSPKEVTTLTHAEIAALNNLTPGYYRIRKMDGSHGVVEVKGQVNSNQQLDRLWILLPQGDDAKNMYPPLASFAEQCNDGNRVSNPLVAA